MFTSTYGGSPQDLPLPKNLPGMLGLSDDLLCSVAVLDAKAKGAIAGVILGAVGTLAFLYFYKGKT